MMARIIILFSHMFAYELIYTCCVWPTLIFIVEIIISSPLLIDVLLLLLQVIWTKIALVQALPPAVIAPPLAHPLTTISWMCPSTP